MPARPSPIAAQRARNARMRAQAERIAETHARSDGEGVVLPVVMIPANTRETVGLPDTSREQFLETLTATIRAAFTLPTGAVCIPETSRALQLPVAAPLGFGCTLCRGECCTAGGNHAFLRADTIERMRREHPELSAEALGALYERELPARHYRGSCVYHTADACALPRALRSDLCNRYICSGLSRVQAAVDSSALGAVYVAAADSVHLRRMAIVSEGGSRAVPLVESRAEPSAVSEA